MGQILNCCNSDARDKSAEFTVEPPVAGSAAPDGPTPTIEGYPEQFGSTDFGALFEAMKENNADKEIVVRESRKDPAGSHNANFWIWE